MALSINGTTGISGVDGSVSAPAVTGTDSNTGITFPSADTIKFSTGGVERMSITNSGVTGTGISNGKLLQTVNATATSSVSVSTNTLTDTGLTADITLTASNSHVLILVTQQFQTHQYNNTGDSDCAILIRRVTSGTTTGVFNPNANVKSIRTSGPGSGSYFVRTGTLVGMSVRDTPGAGTHTYKTSMQHNVRSGTASSANNDSHPAEIVLMEIAA